MSDTFVVNPALSVWFEVSGEHLDAIRLEAPSRGGGWQRHRLTAADRSLFTAVADVAQDRVTVAELARDLSESQVHRLLRMAVLVRPDAIPQEVRYACALEGCGHTPPPSDAVLNPTVRYDPQGFVDDPVFQPGPLLWLEAPAGGVALPYWVPARYQAIVDELPHRWQKTAELPGDLAADLHAVGALTSPARWRRQRHDWEWRSAEAESSFHMRGWGMLRGLLPPVQLAALQAYHARLIDEGYLSMGDEQVPNRWRTHNEPVAQFLHRHLQPLMARLAGLVARPSYVYTVSYRDGAELPPHRDRAQCQFSLSLQLDYRPQQHGGTTPWPLCLQGPTAQDSYAAFLAPGDGLFYQGCDLVHFRPALPPGHESTSLFFHYVSPEFQGALD